VKNYILEDFMKKILVLIMMTGLVFSVFAKGESQQSAGSPAADRYPERTIKFVVNRAAGGATDLVARAVATSLQKGKGFTTVVMNLEGGDGLIGANEAMTSPPDGYTLMVVGSTEIPNILVNLKGAKFTADDVIPICELASKSYLLTLKPNSPHKTLNDFISYAKAHPGEITIAIPGTNNAYGPAFIEETLGIDISPINSGSGNKVYTDVLGGHVECAWMDSNFLANARAEGLTILADTANRKEQVTDRPDSFLFQGYQLAVESFTYICAPKGTPDSVIKFISDTVGSLIKEGELAQGIIATQQDLNFKGYVEFGPYFRDYMASMVSIYNKINAERQ
jgi:tripartite-type tricarboxylate transporter receptor subunit TctC